MKKLLLATLAVFAIFFVVSCSEDDLGGSSVAAGGSCSVEGEESCSSDASQILVCSSSSWQTKKTCNLNFGQYCRQTASGSYSCIDTDNGNATDPTTDPTSDSTEPTETEPADDTEPANNSDPTDDTEPADDTDPVDDSEPVDTDPADDSDCIPNEENTTPIETCLGIVECQNQCLDKCDQNACITNCSMRASTDVQNEFYERFNMCSTYTETEDLIRCQELYVKCGKKGDTNYTNPAYGDAYGHAVINGSFSYVHEAGITSFSQGTYIDTFVTGNFGSSGNIPDPSATESFAFAQLNTAGNIILLRQTYNSNTQTGKTPDVIFVIDAHAPGTYLVGMSSQDHINMYVSENTSSEADACDHAFGYGYLELGGTALAETYTTGAYTLTIKGEVDLYSYKNAPMYVGTETGTGDITNSDLKACPLK